ncbi:MAG: cupin domain-containing protein [Verrucomicrobia bacterium]|nr:cupin domain-containing protein [Verrucomicrobiota bacterium]
MMPREEEPPEEQVGVLFDADTVRIERITSHGHLSPEGFWYDQDEDEWVTIVEGEGAVLFEGEEEPRILKRGDHLFIPAHQRHRVEWTSEEEATVWLAVFVPASPGPPAGSPLPPP